MNQSNRHLTNPIACAGHTFTYSDRISRYHLELCGREEVGKNLITPSRYLRNEIMEISSTVQKKKSGMKLPNAPASPIRIEETYEKSLTLNAIATSDGTLFSSDRNGSK